MSNTLIKVYDHFANAENARNALLSSGFPSESVHLTAQDDESGPVEGNFILESKDAGHAHDRSFLDSLLNRDDPNEGVGRQDVVWRSTFLLTVDVQDDEQFARAADITGKFGARDGGGRSPP
jgi:hypothetical protein